MNVACGELQVNESLTADLIFSVYCSLLLMFLSKGFWYILDIYNNYFVLF
jgi:hypothetical protein